MIKRLQVQLNRTLMAWTGRKY